MQRCPGCGEENPPRFRLCGFCGAELSPEHPAREVRKTVTVVFTDLVGSTALAERLDPEAVRELMTRYFEALQAVLEEHGGTIEKFIGDAVMAVFGLPRVHEDDALRAVRACEEMRSALERLNAELETSHGVRLANRTGVNTGEVVAGDAASAQRLVSGDTVNVAARLEQAASAGEVLLGETTERLVRDAVAIEPVAPLELKGKNERVAAFRLLSAAPAEAPPREQPPLVGRERELALLHAEFETCVASRGCRMVTISAEAGVGKSRLVAELARALAGQGALVLRGRCLAYGRGITFWPLVEIVRQAAGIREGDAPDAARAKIAALEPDAQVVERVAAAIGLSRAQFTLDELAWGARRLLERIAGRQPLLAVFEDVHWAEDGLLGLVEQVLETSTGVPLLLLCTARPELGERRRGELPANARLLELAPLSAVDSADIVDRMLGPGVLPEPLRLRIVEAAGGNPLFVEQLLSMLVDEGVLRRESGRWRASGPSTHELAIPAGIDALLSARLDLLPPEELEVLETASVIGLVFARRPLEQLLSPPLQVSLGRTLDALASKQLVGAAEGDPAGSLRFQHALVRDAAYGRLLKRSRAELHERFADWAEGVNRDRDREIEYEEIVGYHLEQAHRYLAELSPLDTRAAELGSRAAGRLAPAGQRAFARGDMAAAANLLRRAAALLAPGTVGRLALLPDLGEAMMEIGEFETAELYLDEAVAGATALGDAALHADALLTRLLVRHHVVGELDAWRAEVERETARVIPLLSPERDARVLAKAWRMVGFLHGTVCQWLQTAEAEERAIESARRAGDKRQEARLSANYMMALADGPTPASEAIARGEQILERGLADRQAEALVLLGLAPLHAMLDDFARARSCCDEAERLLREIGATVLAANISLTAARIELTAGDAAVAEEKLRRDFENLAAMDERYFRPLVAATLAQSLHALGRLDEAERMAATAAELASVDDVEAQSLIRSVQARLLALARESERALALCEQAVTLARTTDAPVLLAERLSDLAEVLALAGRRREAREALVEARACYALKQHLVGRAGADAALAAIEAAPAEPRGAGDVPAAPVEGR